jgi:hypothetical protein
MARFRDSIPCNYEKSGRVGICEIWYVKIKLELSIADYSNIPFLLILCMIGLA